MKPQINEGGNVRLSVEVSNEEIASTDATLGPTTAKRSVKTQIVAKDQSTIVIGGLIQERATRSVKKVPVLGSLPVLGALFRDTQNIKQKTNLLVFLTPYIIRDEADYRRIYEKKRKEQEDFMVQFYGKKRDYKIDIDYSRKPGPLSRIHQGVVEETARIENGGILFRRDAWTRLHPSLQRGTLREAIRYLRPQARNINWEHIEQARRVGLEGETGAQATLPLALELTVRYDEFVIAPVNFTAEAEHPLLNADRAELRVPGETLLPANSWTVQVTLERKSDSSPVSDGQWQAVLDADKIRGVLYLRKREPGDKFQPSGMGGHTKSLHEFMIDEKIPQNSRDKLPILCDEEKVVWVCGWRVDERVCVSDSTRYVLRVRFVAHVYRDHHLE